MHRTNTHTTTQETPDCGYEAYLVTQGGTVALTGGTNHCVAVPGGEEGGLTLLFPKDDIVLRVSGDEHKGFGFERAKPVQAGQTVEADVKMEGNVPAKIDLRVLFVSAIPCGGLRLRYVHFGFVPQEGRIFWVAQQKKDGALFRSRRDGGIRCADDVRPGLLTALARTIEVAQLPEGDEPLEAPNARPHLHSGEGVVTWFDDVRQVGEIMVRHRGKTLAARAHWTVCPVRPGGRRFLVEGDRVRVGEIAPARDLRSTFKWEIKSPVVLAEPQAHQREPRRDNRHNGHGARPRRPQKRFTLEMALPPEALDALRKVKVGKR